MQPLDPLTIPLSGRRLLEASAGTGKTWTLALLFLRLVLERRLGVDQILVVTFTRAATGELRDRIRARVREALDALDGATADPQLAALLARVEAGAARQLLADALTQMDEAAICTIHGFCQRILQEHAFESGAPFAAEFLEHEHDLRRQVMEDFWRNRFYPAPPEEAAWAAATWGEPAALLERLGRATAALEVELLPAEDPALAAALEPVVREELARAREHWPRVREEVTAILQDSGNRLQRGDKAYRLADRVPELLGAMERLAAATDLPPTLPAGVEKLAAPVMATLLKIKGTEVGHPFFDLFGRCHDAFTRFRRQQAVNLLHEARRFLLAELDRRKRDRGVIAYDDLLTRLDEALARPDSGNQLATRIFARYSAALVDEFQDTDPLQYRLFSRVFDREDGTLFLIGDPKQAIYSFRGADIFTYVRARRETPASQRYTMTTNYRATAAMVAAVNRLFSLRPDPFIFTDGIVFQPVRAAEGAGPPLVVDGEEVRPFTALLLDADGSGKKVLAKKDATPLASTGCAAEIVRMLAAADRGRATIGERVLRAGDIAVLVRTHREAEAVQAALRAHGLASVTLVQASVFASTEALQLARVLAALLDPTDAAAVRTCLATELFGLDAAGLQALGDNPVAWSGHLDRLLAYQRLWLDQGFLVLFQQLLADRQVTRRLTGRAGGERALTNYLHLAELLQDSPAASHGAAALVRWFEQQRLRPDSNSEAQLIRLENDEDLIRIVTIHRAKGLEFPVVFLPFAWSVRTPQAGDERLFHHPTSHHLILDLGTGREEHAELARIERLAEDLRLLYVAVTRAKCCCLFAWGRVNGMEAGGLAQLVHNGVLPATDAELVAGLEQLNGAGPILTLAPCAATAGTARPAPPVTGPGLQPLVFRGRIDSRWSLTSYSRLIVDLPAERERDDEPEDIGAPAAPEDFADIHTFPRGPAAGTCLHTLLERLDGSRPATAQPELINESLARAGIDPRWQPATAAWMDAVRGVALPGSCRLADLADRDRISELAFLFPLEQVSRQRLNTVLTAAGLPSLPTAEGRLQGLMKGFVDLVFRCGGRFYLVDYKSNHLGPDLTHYGPEGLAACMDEHHYHLQYLIYTLAVHRYLQARLPGYSYANHFGGAYYLFLRALHPDHPAGTGVYHARPGEELIRALDSCCRGREAG